MSLERGVGRGVRRNHDDVGSRAVDRTLSFDPGGDGFPSGDSAFSLNVVGAIINNHHRDLDMCNHLFHRGFAGSTSR